MAMQFSARRTVVANPANRGGYSAYDMPDPNEGQFFGNMTPGQARQHNAGLAARAKEFQDEYGVAEEQRRERAGNTGLAKLKSLSAVSASKSWDPFFQALREQGVDKLAADAVTPGGSPSFFGDQFGHSGASLPAGYTHQRAMDELKNYQVTGELPGFARTPGGALAQQTPGANKYAQNVLDGLREGLPRYRQYGYR